MNHDKTHCGFITIVGRSMVGKSTLLNRLIGKKISITSRKTQTTRNSIFGVRTEGKYQAIYIDTPGIHINGRYTTDHLTSKIAIRSTSNVELIIFVVEGVRWTSDDKAILLQLYKRKTPIILAVNKVDLIQNKTELLPHFRFLLEKMKFLEIIPISAKKGINIDNLVKIVNKHLPKAAHHFSQSYTTNCSKQFIASEIIREKLIRFLWKELPYLISVKVELITDKKQSNYEVNGLIFVKCERQKKIVIGKKGEKIKTIGIEARKDMQKIFGVKIHLRLWVKVKNKQSNNEYIKYNHIYSDAC